MMINLNEAEDVEPVERIDVFSLDGVTYSIPAQQNASFALRYLQYVKEHGEDAAAAYLMELMLGEEGYAALASYENLTDTQLLTVFQACLETALGAMAGPKAS